MKAILIKVLIFLPLCLYFFGTAYAAVCDEWNDLEKEIRDGIVARDEAREEINRLHGVLVKIYGGTIGKSSWYFPVKGYGPKSIGGRKGNGYRPKGYDFYQGNAHRGHPAQDLFIRDPGKSGNDARSGRPAEVTAFEDGVVVAVNPSWTYPDRVRGGIYIWTFNPATDRYCYYAHLAGALVTPGAVVRAGEIIANLGRTGKNAWPARSPTHLHFMCLSHAGGAMRPLNTYRMLLKAVVQGTGD